MWVGVRRKSAFALYALVSVVLALSGCAGRTSSN
jgi:hypothetical protein